MFSLKSKRAVQTVILAPLSVLLALVGRAAAEDSIFPDKALETAVRKQVFDKRNNEEPLTKDDVKNVAIIHGENLGIKSLEGIEHCLVVQEIRLQGNEIEDISQLAGLKELLSLNLADNKISDISSVSELKRLQYLNLNGNSIRKLAPLAELTNMRSLYLSNNKIERLGQLKKLTKLWSLYLSGNPLKAAKVMRNLKMVDTLDLSNCGLASIDFIKPMNRLKILNLANNKLDSVATLVEMAKADKDRSFAPFLRVDISGNPLADSKVEQQLKALKEMRVRVRNEQKKPAKTKADSI